MKERKRDLKERKERKQGSTEARKEGRNGER